MNFSRLRLPQYLISHARFWTLDKEKKVKTIFQKATPCSFILYNSIYAIHCTTKIKLSLSYPRPLIEHQNQMIPIDLDCLLLQMKPHEPQQLSIEGLARWPLPALSLVH
ncbi:uncharacterized protein J3R85_001850 [Psidium guajava]|nr:uncharacterized protein J3R85_001850 [Psidium guajava]